MSQSQPLNQDPIEVITTEVHPDGTVSALLKVSDRDYQRLLADRGAQYSIAGAREPFHVGSKVAHAFGRPDQHSLCWRQVDDVVCTLPEGHTREDYELALLANLVDGRRAGW